MKFLFIFLDLVGLAAVCYGAWLLHPAAGWIIFGITAVLIGQGWYNIRRKGGR